MTPDDLRAIMRFLKDRVRLADSSPDAEAAITFATPTLNQMIDAGLDLQGCRQILGATWWDEMVEDVIDTPEMCDPDDPPEQTLQYAQDVVEEYLRKRASL